MQINGARVGSLHCIVMLCPGQKSSFNPHGDGVSGQARVAGGVPPPQLGSVFTPGHFWVRLGSVTLLSIIAHE